MADHRQPRGVKEIAADLCREILANHADRPLALQVPEHIWPRVYARNPACPAFEDSRPAAPCVLLTPGDSALYVHVFPDGAWADPEPDWLLPYPEGFEPFRSYPDDMRLGAEFRVELVRRIARRIALITAATKVGAATVPGDTDNERA